jgi:DNA-binding NarL/FixJ family response regulator
MGSNWLQCRTRQQPIRTLSLLSVTIKITINEAIPLYQKLSPKIKELKALGMLNQEIADKLTICRKTVRKGLSLDKKYQP